MANITKVRYAFFTSSRAQQITGKLRGGIRTLGTNGRGQTRIAIGRGRLGNPNPTHKFQKGNQHAKKNP